MSEPHIHVTETGDPAGHPVVFAHALGLDSRLWDQVLPLLPPGLRLITYDLRGHGRSDCPPPPYAMGALVKDAERLIEGRGLTGVTFVGLSIGGMIAQALAVKRPDLVGALVLSNTAPKIGTVATWADRIAKVEAGGMAAILAPTIERWFSRRSRAEGLHLRWQEMLAACRVDGYVGCCQAISGTDLLTPTSGLQLPTLVIAGSDDGSTPPDLVRELADLIHGARFQMIRGAGHLPPADRPQEFAAALANFIQGLGCTCGHHHH